MHEDESVSDDDIKAAARAGTVRCFNARRTGTSVLRPVADPDAFGLARHDYLVARVGEDSLAIYYQELLRRADAFLSFCRGNLGNTPEYPLMVRGESPESISAFYDQLEHFSVVVGLLNES